MRHLTNHGEQTVAAFGAAHMDTIARLHAPLAAASVPGRTVAHAGGAAFNVCRHLASAGLAVELHTPPLEPNVAAAADAANVALRPLGPRQARPPSYTAILDASGNLAAACADMESYDELRPAAVANLPSLESVSLVLVDANLPADVLAALVETLDPAVPLAALTVSPAKAPRLRGILHRINVLFASRSEAQVLHLHSRRPPTLHAVVTDGPNAIAVLGEHESRIAIDPVEPVDVTGAGDALAGGTLVHMLRGTPLEEAVRLAVPVARRAVTQEGPFNPCPELGEAHG